MFCSHEEKLKVKFLTQAEEIISSTSRALKCHFAFCRDTVAEWAGARSKGSTNLSQKVRCQFCLTKFDAANSNVKIVRNRESSKLKKKILKKHRRGLKLSLAEENLKKLMEKGNKVVVTCNTCHKKSSTILPKRVTKVKLTEEPKKKRQRKNKVMKDRTLLEDSLLELKKERKKLKASKRKKPLISNPEASSSVVIVDETIVIESGEETSPCLILKENVSKTPQPKNLGPSFLADCSSYSDGNVEQVNNIAVGNDKPERMAFEMDHGKRKSGIPMYEVKKSLLPSKKVQTPKFGSDFLPLDTSSPAMFTTKLNQSSPKYLLSTPLPNNKNKQEKKRLFVNPLALKNAKLVQITKTKKQNRLSSLQKLLNEEKQQRTKITLNNFLNAL